MPSQYLPSLALLVAGGFLCLALAVTLGLECLTRLRGGIPALSLRPAPLAAACVMLFGMNGPAFRVHGANGFYVNRLINRLLGAYRLEGARSV